MFSWVIALFVLAIVAGVFGFGGLVVGLVGIAKVVFWVALVLAVLGFFIGRHSAP